MCTIYGLCDGFSCKAKSENAFKTHTQRWIAVQNVYVENVANGIQESVKEK